MSCGINFVKRNCNYKNDYACQRKCNISKLEQLYNKELNNYYNTYTTYLKLKYSVGRNSTVDRRNAETKWRPKVANINARLNKILTDIKANINHTKSLINSQEKEIEIKNNNIYQRNKKITDMANLIDKNTDDYVSKERQIVTGEERNRFRRNSMYFLILLNVIVIGVLGYLLTKK